MTAAGSALAEALDAVSGDLLTLPHRLETAGEDGPISYEIAETMARVGWSGIAVTEGRGGLDLSVVDFLDLCEVVGRRLIPWAIREEAVLLAPLLERLAARGHSGASDMLSGLMSGALRGGSAAILEPGDGSIRTSMRGCEVTLVDTPAWLVPGAQVVAVHSETTVALVDLRAADVEIIPARALEAGQGFCHLRCSPHTIAEDAVATGSEASALLHRYRAALLAEALGVGEEVLRQAVAYAREREQFGRPIYRFQAIAHHLSNAKVGVDASRSGMARLVAMTPPSWQPDAATQLFVLALSHALPQYARETCETAIQVHGAIGFTWEYGLHLHYRRALSLQAILGGADGSAARVGARYLEERRASRG
jgi:alkylation response protein AidB-like acyl-CoA dehydrogenase